MEAHASDSGTDKGEGQDKEPYLAKLFKRLVLTLDKTNYVLDETIRRLETSVPRPSQSVTSYSSEKGLEIKKEEKVKVEVKCTFMKINDIDTVDQQFEAEIFIQAKWEDPLLDGLPVKDYDSKTMWNPRLVILNLDGDFALNRKSFSIVKDDPAYDHTLVINLWRFKGMFKENLELENFPLDVQDLTISISTERSNEELELIEDQRALSYVNTKAFMDAQEWSLYEHVETYRDNTTVEYASATIHPIIHAQCRVCRKVGYFIWNIIFIVFLIISLTFATFAIEPDSADRLAVTITLFLTAVAFKLVVKQSLPTISYLTSLFLIISLTFATFAIEPDSADRLAVTITLFLTAVTFKLVVKQSLPTISYLTSLDLYVLACLMYLGLNAAQNATIKTLAKSMEVEKLESYDRYSIVSLAIIFFAFHVIFGIYLYLTSSKRRRVMEEKDKLYKAKKKYLRKYGTLSEINTAIIIAKQTAGNQ